MADAVIAVVQAVSGEVFARSVDGELRPLRAGDSLLAGESLVNPQGAQIVLLTPEGEPFSAGALAQAAGAAATAAAPNSEADVQSDLGTDDVEQVLQALESGEDIGSVVEETAAGSGGGSGAEGSSFIRLSRIDEGAAGGPGGAAPGTASGSAVGQVATPLADANEPLLALPEISVNDVQVAEGGVATVTVSLSEPSNEGVSVNFRTRDGTAVALEGDYVSESGLLTFLPGQTELTVQLITIADNISEQDETFDVLLSSPVNGVLGDGVGVVTISAGSTGGGGGGGGGDGGPLLLAVGEFRGGLEGNPEFMEAALPDGSAPDPGALTLSGSFTVFAEGELAAIRIEEVDVFTPPVPAAAAGGEWRGIAIAGGEALAAEGPVSFVKEGIALTVERVETGVSDTGINTYTVFYSLSLQAPSDHAPPTEPARPESESLLIPFAIEVEDASGQVVQASGRSVRVSDDSPFASDDVFTFSAANAVLEGNVITDGDAATPGDDVPGADGSSVRSVTVADQVLTLDGGTVVAAGQFGQLSVSPSGGFRYELTADGLQQAAALTAGAVLQERFGYRLGDADGDPSGAFLSITITAPGTPPPPGPDNLPPLAVDDQFSTTADTALVAGVLANDSDPDGDTFTVVANSSPGNGSLVMSPDGVFTYQPDTGFQGIDSFTYTISDGFLENTATVTISVGDSDVRFEDFTPETRGIERQFDEALLPQGTAYDGSDQLTRSGSFSIFAPDGLASVRVNGSELLDASGALVAGTLVQDSGGYIDVTFTGLQFDVATGIYTVSYRSTLNGAFPHAAESDSEQRPFTLVAADSDGDEATTTRFATIVDDQPLADDDGTIATVADRPGDVLVGSVAADLLEGDDYGADGAAADGIQIAAGDLGGSIVIDGDALRYSNPDLAVAAGGSLVETFQYTLIDSDGDSATASFSIALSEGAPVLVQVSNDLLADDDDALLPLAPGNPGGTGDDATVLSGTISYDTAGNGPGSVALSTAGNATGLFTLDGVAVVTAFTGGVLVGYRSGGDPASAADQVFTISLGEPGAGEIPYRMVLLRPLRHAPGSDENNTAGFAVNVVVTDSRGVQGATSFAVVVDDDTPLDFQPDTTAVVDGSGAASLPVALNFAATAGADGAGAVVFAGFSDGAQARDAQGLPLKLGTADLFLYGSGTTLLSMRTAGGVEALQVALNGDTYTVIPVNGTLSNGMNLFNAGIDGVGGGNVDQKLLLDPFAPVSTMDVILTGVGNNGDNTVNTNAGQIGVGRGNDLDFNAATGDVLTMEFVTGAQAGSSSFDERVSVNHVVLPMENVRNDATAEVSVYDGAQLVGTFQYSAADVADGSIVVSAATEFTTLVIAATAGTFKIGSFSLMGFVPGEPIDIALGVAGVDGDGDAAAGSLQFTVQPKGGALALAASPGGAVTGDLLEPAEGGVLAFDLAAAPDSHYGSESGASLTSSFAALDLRDLLDSDADVAVARTLWGIAGVGELALHAEEPGAYGAAVPAAAEPGVDVAALALWDVPGELTGVLRQLVAEGQEQLV